jgi:chromosome segregation protein
VSGPKRGGVTEALADTRVVTQPIQVQLITNAIKNAEKQLNDLLSIAGRGRVALRFAHVDLGNPDLPLRWKVRPEWILPEGRMIVVDESGNNLDGGNLRRLAGIPDHVAVQYGLTVVLACQDVYAHLIAPHTAGVAKLLRLGASDVLNAHPVVVHGPDEPEVVRLFAPYLA